MTLLFRRERGTAHRSGGVRTNLHRTTRQLGRLVGAGCDANALLRRAGGMGGSDDAAAVSPGAQREAQHRSSSRAGFTKRYEKSSKS